jgi:hypothetical protein
MSFGIRAVTVTVFAGVALGTCYLLLAGSDGKGWVSSLLLGEAVAESERLDRTHVEVLDRMLAGEARINALGDGRATLREVAGDLIAMHEDQPHFCQALAIRYPGRTDLERVARAALNRAYYNVLDPVQQEAVGRRLVEEFRTTFPDAVPFEFDGAPEPMPIPPLSPFPGPEPGSLPGVPRAIAIPIPGPPPR